MWKWNPFHLVKGLASGSWTSSEVDTPIKFSVSEVLDAHILPTDSQQQDFEIPTQVMAPGDWHGGSKSSVSHACVSVATRDQQRELVCLFSFHLTSSCCTLQSPGSSYNLVASFFWPIFLDFAEINNSTIKFNIFWVRIMYKMLQSTQRRLLSLIIE